MPANSELERLAKQKTVVRQYLHEFDKVDLSFRQCYQTVAKTVTF
jgi:hypothetical protein